MAATDLRVTLDADAAKLERAIQRTQRQMQALEREIAGADKVADQFNTTLNERTAKTLENMGRGMVAFGAATLAGLGLATKAAIDWESAWAGVVKTVEGSPQQLAEVEAGLRDLATTLPATHQEIAAVAEAAGQLGIATGDVVSFTRVMVDLGETTNLTADEAATAIAQMMNVMQTAPQDVDRLGAALVELGNNGASTERDIIEMAQRIAGAGGIVGLTEADVLALANALASVGIEAEAGGTAISTAMIKMASAVAEGGSAVSGFAEVAGMSAAEFVRAFETDPARAIQAFVEGLGRMDAAGENVFAVIDNLGLGTIRTRDALLRLAGAGDLLEQSLNDGARAWEENTALIEEAEKRYDTAEAKIQIALNTLNDLAIDVGSVILPAVSGLAEGAADLARFFSDLPGSVKTLATILGGLAGTAALVGGGFLLLAPRLAAARAEIQLLSITSPNAARAMSLLGKTAAITAGIAAVAGALAFLASTAGDTDVGVGQATEALIDLRTGVSNDLIKDLVRLNDEVNNSNTAWRFLTSSGEDFFAAGNEFEATVKAIDTALSHMVSSGNAEGAAESVNELGKQMGLSGDELDAFVRERFPAYQDALAQVEADNKIAAESVDPVIDRFAELSERFGLTGDDAEKAARKMLDAWSESFTGFVDLVGGYNDVLARKEEAERKTAEETAAATEDAGDSWEDYVKEVSVSIDEYLAELEKQVAAQEEWAGNMLILSSRVSDGTLDQLARLGPEGAPLVAELVDASDEELARFEELSGRRMKDAGDEMADRLADAGPALRKIAKEHGQDVADSIARGMAENGTTVEREARRQGVRIDRGVGTNRTRRPGIEPDLDNRAADRVNSRLNSVARDRTATIFLRQVGSASGRSGGELGFRPHGGGVIGRDPIPRFHNGGISNDEVFAILQTGERVLSRQQNAAFEHIIAAANRLPSMPATSTGAEQRFVIEFRSDGTPMGDMLIKHLAPEIRGRGGDVQLVLGAGVN